MIEIRNETRESAELYISGNIIDDDTGGMIDEWCENSTGYQWPDKIRQQLDGLRGKDLTIYINSDGGSVPAGVAMANMIARHEGHTTAIVDGWCCSIATQIFFSADVRRIPANAYLMIHKPAVWNTGGNADDLRREADVLDTIQQGLEATYRKAAHEDVSDADIRAMVDEETWLTGEQAAAFFQVEVLESVCVAACVGSVKRMQNVPPDVRLAATAAPHKEVAAKEQHDDEKGCQKAAQVNKARVEIALALAKGATI